MNIKEAIEDLVLLHKSDSKAHVAVKVSNAMNGNWMYLTDLSDPMPALTLVKALAHLGRSSTVTIEDVLVERFEP